MGRARGGSEGTGRPGDRAADAAPLVPARPTIAALREAARGCRPLADLARVAALLGEGAPLGGAR